jgi:hypothetical protein
MVRSDRRSASWRWSTTIFRSSRATTLCSMRRSAMQVEGWPSYGVAPNSQVKLRVGGKKHRICFVMPSNSKEAAPPSGELEMPGERRIERLARSVKTYKVGGELGGEWRKLLGG